MLTFAHDNILTALLDEDIFFLTLLFVCGTIITIVAIIHNLLVSRSREQTKREIAAYVAEGSIDADKAIAMIAASADAAEEEA